MLESDANTTADVVDYSLTPLGEALLDYLAAEMGFADPEVRAYLEARLEKTSRVQETEP
jgi:DNA-binding HxlR family transcriptional regulator